MTRTLEPRLLSLNVIAEQVEIPLEKRKLDWLKKSLQAAIELELATMPPYLCGYWSIAENGKGNAEGADLMRSVFMEEMLHLGLAGNMLKAVGGEPKIIRALHDYPGRLPGGVLEKLIVQLAGLTPAQVDIYMAIEEPEKPIPDLIAAKKVTIGVFYHELWRTFEHLKPTLSAAGQMTSGGVKLTKVTTLEEVRKAITLIREQGEGTPTDRGAPSSAEELAHYYRFRQLHTGRKYEWNTQKKQWVPGRPGSFPFPGVVYPMATLPAEGWHAPPPVQDKLDGFNRTFLTLLAWLESAWSGGGQTDLGNAVRAMRGLGGPAVELMQVKMSGGPSTYGPDFRALPHWTRDIAPALKPLAAAIKAKYQIDAADYRGVKDKAPELEKDMRAAVKPFDSAWTRAQTLIFIAWRETGFPM